jgi:hypothetical protein
MQLEILSGWASAARETGEPLAQIAGWLSRRREIAAAGQSSIRIGHTDFWAAQTGNL